MITYEIPVLMDRENQEKGPLIKRHDSGVNLAVRLMRCNQVSRYRETFEPYSIPKGAIAVLRVKKPDKTKVVVDVKPLHGTNTVLCRLPPEALAAPGTCSAEIALYSEDDKRLTSSTFYFDVSEECVCDDDPKSENYVDAYGEIKKGIEETLRRIGDPNELVTEEKDNLVRAINEIVRTGGATDEQIANAVAEYLKENPIDTGVQFETDETLSLENGVLSVNTADKAEKDNTLPITSAAVHTQVGNIEILLKTI